jgi:hypothetical protein
VGLSTTDCSHNELRWIADAYEQAQGTRVQTGERIRALLQGRDGSVGANAPYAGHDAGEILERIRRNETEGPSPFLARVYRLNASAEEAAQAAMRGALGAHPAWPWLGGVRGVGDTLACRLLARLDPTRAATPSSFWAYCGLSTVAGREYMCATCGRVATQPVAFQVTGVHKRLGGRGRCPDLLRPTRGPEAGVRAAQPRRARGARALYNPQAKKICYLICVSFLRCGGPYADRYRAVRADLERDRPGWERGRLHLTAARKTQKLFLTHLWLVWREAIGLSVTAPHAGRRSGWDDPWRMTSADASAHVSADASAA